MIMKRQNIRTLSLIVCTFTYLLIGAAIFDALEAETEEKQRRMLRDLDTFYRDKYNISSLDWKIMETVMIKSVPHKAGTQWRFAGAIYFATTVITTIGYGHSTPLTFMGKGFCMVYASMGIPLGLVMFQCIGERLNTFVAFVLKAIKKCLRLRNTEPGQGDLIMVIGLMSFIVIFGGAAGFSYYENWEYFDSIYYCFITLSTIGFGDFVAMQKNGVLESRPEYVAFSLIFILFGLNTFAALMNLLVLRFITANTQDERAQALEAEAARATAVHVEGDIITHNKANGSICSGHEPERREPPMSTREVYYRTVEDDGQSVCSCTCYRPYRPPEHALDYSLNTMTQRGGKPRHYTVRRSPTKIAHLLPMETFITDDTDFPLDPFAGGPDDPVESESNAFLQAVNRGKRHSF
ncbi:two pore potassium channel protein sup-9-like [Paramacrobiotus metropolitanus]|uniref:two pore potassium channel protein sup-9-like n=1 Tax=Paramacrobiotus metropolitanus TaxID=2943436 RepID=UPI0024459361|nr:two pore potassium channel protein sup-9-like [Paramacrobiotus metropolitanus]